MKLRFLTVCRVMEHSSDLNSSLNGSLSANQRGQGRPGGSGATNCDCASSCLGLCCFFSNCLLVQRNLSFQILN